ncbi:MFS transporter, DHA1 family, bicyclomycin/chloramphenicol resistance protein [Nocardioides exalbidus]|uniref:MFS transporter, DHA1 family, bicyclomycin/chloramphenicol resistance protein n=1 Tax=Nocardioides exalbidus TaxID=402596 RepID=A0A1H4RUZ6_9ACTN|nr:multidrug effflux MFS transporter [Nocardioides exalbidus]SEC35733.1 MFS transporter, DHA1 family, bicyclomycin/chloramphenicol resistance protein [Nocardioides exalbidus]
MTATDSSRDRAVASRAVVLIPLVLALLSMIGPFSIDTPFPAFTQMGEALDVGSHELQLVVTAYMLAFATMSLFHGPLSDAIGRRPVIMGSLVVYAVASVACAFAPTLELLLVGRVVQGLAAGGSTIVSRTVIRDLFDGPQAQRMMSQVAVIFGVAPAIAPIIGGLLIQVGPWETVFWFMAVMALLLIVLSVALLPESHPVERRVPLRVGEIFRGLVQVARVPSFHRMTWAATLVFGAQFLYIGGASIFVVDLLGEGELDFWKLFVPMIGGMVVGSVASGRFGRTVTSSELVTFGYAVSTVGAVVGILVALTPAGEMLPWAVVGISLVAFGNGLAFPNIQLLMLDLVPARRGAVMSASSFVTLVFNAVSAAVLAPYAGRSVLGFAVAAAGCVLLGWGFWTWNRIALRRQAAARS